MSISLRSRVLHAKSVVSCRLWAVAFLLFITLVPGLAGAQSGWVYRYSPEPQVRSLRVFANTPTTGTTMMIASSLGGGVFRGYDSGSSWTWQRIGNGLPTGRLFTLAMLDTNNGFAATDGFGVYRTTDGGNNWFAANGSGATALGCRVIRTMAVIGATIYAGTWCRYNSGIYKSTDNGNTWSRLATALIPTDSESFSVVLNSSGTMVALTTNNYGVFRSLDSGATWAQINAGLPANPSVFNIQCGAACTGTGSYLLAYVKGAGVYKWTDTALAWTQSSSGLPSSPAALAGIGRDGSTTTPSFTLAMDKQGIYKSTDNGATWALWGNTATATPFARSVSRDTTGANKYYVNGLDGIYRTTDDGATWTATTLGYGGVNSISHDIVTPTIAYLASVRPLKVANVSATDYTGNVTAIDSGITANTLGGTVTVDPITAGVMYATTSNRGIFKTTNGGAGWSAINTGLPSMIDQPGRLHIDPSNNQVLYLSSTNDAGIFKSTNGGASWAAASTGLSTKGMGVSRIEIDPNTTATLYASTKDGVYKSTNGASTWTLVYSAVDSANNKLPVHNIRLNQASPQQIYIANSHIEPIGTTIASSGVLKSIDGGTTWTNVLPGIPVENLRVLTNGHVYAGLQDDASRAAVMRSTDGGATWVPLGVGLLSRAIATFGLDKAAANVLTLGLDDGFYTATNDPGGQISTIAGTGPADGGAATSAAVLAPSGVAVDSAGNLYISERYNLIRKVTASTGVISTLAGTGGYGFNGDNINAAQATVSNPRHIVARPSGDVIFADQGNARVRKIAPNGVITTIAGNGTYTHSGDGGPATSAGILAPEGVAVDSAGNIFISDNGTHRVRRIDAATGIITTVAGNGTAGYSGDGAGAAAATLSYPKGLAFDTGGNLYIADSNNHRVRRIAAGSGIITTVAGSGASFGPANDGGLATAAVVMAPVGVVFNAAGDLFISEQWGHRVRKVFTANGLITTIAGDGTSGSSGDNVAATAAQLDQPQGIAFDGSSNLYIADLINNRVRKVAAAGGIVTTFAGRGNVEGTAALSTPLYLPQAMVMDAAGNLYVAENANQRVRKIAAGTGIVTTIAGGGPCCSSGNGGPATSAYAQYPTALALDGTGNLYLGDGNSVRKVALSTGIITNFAGNGTYNQFGGDGGPATSAAIGYVSSLAVDGSGNVFIADGNNPRIRKVATGSGIISTIAGTGIGGFSGDSGPATSAQIGSVQAMAFDAAGNLHLADPFGSRVRKITPAGIISTVAGAGGSTVGTGDGGPALSAFLCSPTGLAFDSAGNLFITECTRIRRVSAATGVITTVANVSATAGFSGDGGPAANAWTNVPRGPLFSVAGELIFADMLNGRIRRITPDVDAPDTQIVNGPSTTMYGNNAFFNFSGNDPGGGATAFQCSLDGAAYVACNSSWGYSNLALGTHMLSVRAIDGWGNFDATPTSFTWKVNANPSMSTALSQTLALSETGKVFAWGSDSHGQLGQGRAISKPSPRQVTGLPAISQLSLAEHALALDSLKQVWSWGENSCGGQLGPRDASVTSKPGRVIGASNMTKVSAGPCYSLALKNDGTVWGWGVVPGYGTVTTLRQLSGLTGIVDISAGFTHALALKSDGTVLAFGDNGSGQLGLGSSSGAQAAIAVPGLAGVAAIAANHDISLVLRSTGELLYWGKRWDFTTVATPTALPSPGGTAVAISVADFIPTVARADGAVLRLDTTNTTWQPVTGFSGIRKLAAAFGFTMGIDGSGQLFAAGSNTAGELGQGNNNPTTSVLPVSGFNSSASVAVSTTTASVLALKNDGSVWFWGADTVGQSGDGGSIDSSVPLAVNIPTSIVQVAASDRFSLALDVNGQVWGWGDNSSGVFGSSLVSRSTPSLIPGVSGVQSIAAGNGFALYQKVDGTVMKSGTMAQVPGSPDPTPVAGLSQIGAIGAGTSGYAVNYGGQLYAFGANAGGQLGNGTTTPSATPIPVNGIGQVAFIGGGTNRVTVVGRDSKVWSWGDKLLGNGTTGGSPTPVQVTSITDANGVAVGAEFTLVRRNNGGMWAWGNTGLSDSSGRNLASPYAVTFSPVVRQVVAGRNNTVGFILAGSGSAWGFGFGNNVPSKATLGDGAYVARTRPVVVLASGGSGSLDTNNWFLDLDSQIADTIPAASIPTSLGVARLFGSDSGLSLDATVKYKAADQGKRINNYAFALVPAEFFGLVKNAPGTPSIAVLKSKAKAGFVLAQLTPGGWTSVNGQLIAYSQGTANAAGGAVNILNGISARTIPGARFCIGYGENSGSMLSFQALSEVLLLEGAASNAAGVPCVLTGMYVDGPVSSRLGSAVTFKGSVVGLTPTGTAQFKDGAASLSGPLTLDRSNDAVGSISVSTPALTLGVHSIGGVYGGDSQNASVAAEIPVRHEVVAAAPGETRTSLSGPASSDAGSVVVFNVTVTGDSPSGTVQVKDGGANLGEAIPVVGGVATVRTSSLATGARTITAIYSGDPANGASAATPFTHTVYAAIVTSIALSASPETLETGKPVTLTAAVTGTNPSGSVTFRDGGTVLGTGTLANGVANLTISNLQSGPHAITVEYAGDGSNQAVSSSAAFVTVSVPGELNLSPAGFDFGGQSMRTTQSQDFILLNTTTAPITVSSVTLGSGFAMTHDCATVTVNNSCTVRVSFTPTTQAQASATLTLVTSAGNKTATVSGIGEKSLVSHYYRSILRRAPDAGGKAFWEAEAARVAGLGANINETWFALALTFYTSTEYLAFNRNSTEYVRDLYSTFFNRDADSGGLTYWTGLIAQGLPRDVVLVGFMFSPEFSGFAQAIFGNTAARAEVDTVVDFYRGLLTRLPDSGGFNYWVGEFRKAQCKGPAEIYAQVESISSAYANSPEYGARNRTNTQYMGDLYNAFLRRGGDLAGVQYWISQLDTNARTRDNVRGAFISSPEFSARVQKIVDQGCLN